MTEITEAVERLKGDADYIAKCSPNISTLWDRGVGNRRYINSVGRDIDALLSELTRLQEEVKGLRARASELDGELRGLLHGLPELLESGDLTDEAGLIEKAWMTLTRPETEAALATLRGQQS